LFKILKRADDAQRSRLAAKAFPEWDFRQASNARAFSSRLARCRVADKTFRLETSPGWWEIPTMTVVADNKKRVTLRLANPGDRFDVRVAGDGQFILTKLEPVSSAGPARVRIEKRGEYHVGVLDHAIDEKSLAKALAEFP
jgi:hypothetical protein